MENKKGNLKICDKWHRFYKSSGCNTCPKFETKKFKQDPFFSNFSAPAARALKSAGVLDLDQLGEFSDEELLSLHEFGKASSLILAKLISKKNSEAKSN